MAKRLQLSRLMFSVLFEVHPKTEHGMPILASPRLLRPGQLEPGPTVLSTHPLSESDREGSDSVALRLARREGRRPLAYERAASRGQEKRARRQFMWDYHLRVGSDAGHENPRGQVLANSDSMKTETGEGTTVTLIDSRRSTGLGEADHAEEIARWLGLEPQASGLVTWDVLTRS